MTARAALVHRLAALLGPGVLEVEDVQAGWPALATLRVEGQTIPLALFAGQVGVSHRERDDVERRFQNPSGDRPLIGVPGRVSVLVGLWEEDPHLAVTRPIVVTANAARREGRPTRWSAFALLSTLTDALATGWATHVSDSGELIRCVAPALLPAAIVADMAGVEPAEPALRAAIEASGLLHAQDGAYGDDPAIERARRAATSLVRDARFSRRVLEAYGYRCAMCGIGLSLVQGAHIYPASAPGSSDEPWNGLALCANHHIAFDRCMVGVTPGGLQVVFRADVIDEAAHDPITEAFVNGTRSTLLAAAAEVAPRAEMFVRRYNHYGEQYGWLRPN